MDIRRELIRGILRDCFINFSYHLIIHGVIVCDFDDLLNAEDKCGSVEHPQWLFDGSCDIARGCNLIDLEL